MFRYKNKGLQDFLRDGQIKLSYLIGNYLRAPISKQLYQYKYTHLAPLDKTIEVKIENIIGWPSGAVEKEASFQGQICSGNWDQEIRPMEERLKTFPKYIGICERYIEKKEWIDTALFEYYKFLLDQNRQVLCRNSIKDIVTYYEENIDSLFNEIKMNGILPASRDNLNIQPLFILIGRNGELIFTNDGNHRLSMALVSNIKTIPVQVWKRHRQWQQKREIILGEKEVPEELKPYLNHPDIKSELNNNQQIVSETINELATV